MFETEHGSTFGMLGPTLEICLIDLLLSGDNAVVIALVCRGMPPRLWRRVVWLGTAAAVVLRIGLTAFAALILNVPYLKVIGAVLLVAIGIKLLVDEPPSAAELDAPQQKHDLWKALTTIVVADTVMSLDNVLAVAAAAHGSFWLLAFGLLLSIPILIFGSVAVARMLERYPLLILAGGALLGWVAGDTAVSDPAIKDWIDSQSFGLAACAPLIGAVYVLMQARFARGARAQAASVGAGSHAVPALRSSAAATLPAASSFTAIAATAALPAAVVPHPTAAAAGARPASPAATPGRPPQPVASSSPPPLQASALQAADGGQPGDSGDAGGDAARLAASRRVDLIITAAILIPLSVLIAAVYLVAWSIRHH